MVRLILLDLNAEAFAVFRKSTAQRRKALAAVQLRLADAEHIQIRSVEHQKLHFSNSSVNCLTTISVTCAGSPSDGMTASAVAR